MHSGPGMIWEGLNVVKSGWVMLREINLADSKNLEPGAISASKWAGTSSMDSTNKEISLWFKSEELVA